jgi:hypothetical protein
MLLQSEREPQQQLQHWKPGPFGPEQKIHYFIPLTDTLLLNIDNPHPLHDAQFNLSSAVLKSARHKLQQLLDKHEDSLPEWAIDFLGITAGSPSQYLGIAKHPVTKRPFSIPAFRCLWKVHKAKPDTRPITGNHSWILQPLSDLVDFLIMPYARTTPNYIRDSDAAILNLENCKVLDGDLLVSFDWTNLYPSINHALLLKLLHRFLTRANCTCTNFICEAVNLFLTENYCEFDGMIYRQILGFATGVSAGASLAHIFLFELTRETFGHYSQNLPFLKCYIDDGLLIWRGPRQNLDTLL